jgi:GTPase involved in cell partitioning and DNA repair
LHRRPAQYGLKLASRRHSFSNPRSLTPPHAQNPDVDVGEQYVILRRELQLYNPRYLDRPHIVALNKLDVFLACHGPEPDALAAETRRLTKRLAEAARDAAAAGAALGVGAGVEAAHQLTPPLAVLPISGMRGKGLKALQEAVSAALADIPEDEAVAS